jgi:uncharacterized membrane protein
MTGAYAGAVVLFSSHPYAPVLNIWGPPIAIILMTSAISGLLTFFALLYCTEVLTKAKRTRSKEGIALAVTGAVLSTALLVLYGFVVMQIFGLAIGLQH